PAPPAPALAVPDTEGPQVAVLGANAPVPTHLREIDMLSFEGPVGAARSIPLEYRRGVEERVVWEGAGQGILELKNAYGQVVYRVTEGAEPRIVTVPAGRYTLTVTPDASRPAAPLTIAVTPLASGLGHERALYQPDDAIEKASTDRAGGSLCDAVRRKLEELADHEALLQVSPEQPRFNPSLRYRSKPVLITSYLKARAELSELYSEDRERISASCDKSLFKHMPAVMGDSVTVAMFPYFYRYYLDNIK
ncbi:MAG: hypothetical protein ACLGIN_02640, partial [Candidatus Sericytochromatia bacterium]